MRTNGAPLSEEQIANYRRDGYLSVENVLDPGEVAELQQVTETFVERSRTVTSHTEDFDLEPGHTAESPKLRRLKDPTDSIPSTTAFSGTRGSWTWSSSSWARASASRTRS